ncbi:MAG: hypothetical protein PUA47_00515 [Bacteroidales bacterium]|nr:hypothetical protein [Bacteroidales bacterium]
MKNFFRSALAAAAAFAMLSGFVSCDPTNSENEGDTTALETIISECESLLANSSTNDYPQDAITSFTDVINSAKAALDKTGLTQAQIDALVVAVTKAKETFLAAAFAEIPESALVFGLPFDEGTGTSISTKGNKWTANFVNGPAEIFGDDAGTPAWVEGKVGKAIELTNGACLHISDYNPTAMPSGALSITCWLKPSVVRAGNYVLSYNYWNVFKFQIQDGSKPFLTAKAGDTCIDMDNETDNSVPANTWTHVAVTADFATKTCCFYINGVLTKEWVKDAWGNTLAEPTAELPIVIGACTTLEEAKTWDWFKAEPASWDSFYGAIDELALYNVALTAGQVSKLYNAAN